jgi:hypothetical protein
MYVRDDNTFTMTVQAPESSSLLDFPAKITVDMTFTGYYNDYVPRPDDSDDGTDYCENVINYTWQGGVADYFNGSYGDSVPESAVVTEYDLEFTPVTGSYDQVSKTATYVLDAISNPVDLTGGNNSVFYPIGSLEVTEDWADSYPVYVAAVVINAETQQFVWTCPTTSDIIDIPPSTIGAYTANPNGLPTITYTCPPTDPFCNGSPCGACCNAVTLECHRVNWMMCQHHIDVDPNYTFILGAECPPDDDWTDCPSEDACGGSPCGCCCHPDGNQFGCDDLVNADQCADTDSYPGGWNFTAGGSCSNPNDCPL